jgi:hypothetical protein
LTIITLTEAVTGFVCNQPQKADEFCSEQLSELRTYTEEYKNLAKLAHQAAKAAGFPEDWKHTSVVAAEAEKLPEVATLFAFTSERVQRKKAAHAAFDNAVTLILRGASSGELILFGFPNGATKAERIHPSDLIRLTWHDSAMDCLVAKDNRDLLWQHITVDRNLFEKWAKNFNRPASDTPKPFTTAATDSAVTMLAEALKESPSMRKCDAKALLHAANIQISGREFEHKVWPEAREAATLSRKAGAGRKPTSQINRSA